MMAEIDWNVSEMSTIAKTAVSFFLSESAMSPNSRREMFGFPRLKTLLEEHSDEASLIDLLLRELKSFTGEGWEQEDDVTMVVLHAENV